MALTRPLIPPPTVRADAAAVASADACPRFLEGIGWERARSRLIDRAAPLAGAASGLAVATVVNRLPRRVRHMAVAQLCAIFGAVEVGAALHSGDRRQAAVESVVATGYVAVALLVASHAPRRLPLVVSAHALWDAGQHRRGDAVPPATWYPAFCAALDLTAAVRLRT